MRSLIGLLITAVIVVLGYWIYASKMQSSITPGSPAQVISTVGVQSDLLSIAEAERTYWAQHGSYVSVDELYSSGALTAQKSGRDGYTYSAETSASGFTVTARCQAAAAPACPSFAIDQTMQVRQVR